MIERSQLSEEIRRIEKEEELSTLLENTREEMADKVQCDECGLKLPSIYDEGVIKVDVNHHCEVPAVAELKKKLNIGQYFFGKLNEINEQYIKDLGDK